MVVKYHILPIVITEYLATAGIMIHLIYKAAYGALYNYYTVNTGKICPAGWHVPTDTEWSTLLKYLGGEGVAGGKLKETGLTQWLSPNTGATNESGFTALPGGFLFFDGTFKYVCYCGVWWSSTEY